LARCLHCGQCAQICPFACITLRTGFNPLLSGTPQIDPRVAPCQLCMRCSMSCPSGALQNVAPEEAAMGHASLDRKLCHTWEGFIICRSCFERCPLKGRAIVLEQGIYPVVTEYCVGCGICEHVCPQKAIVTIPSRFAA
jgi:ferredoxin